MVAPSFSKPQESSLGSKVVEGVKDFAVENALPIAGGVGGFLVGGPVGAAVGSGIGRVATEELQNLGQQDKSQGKILVEGLTEGAVTYVGGKVLDKTLPIIGEALSTAAEKFSKKPTFSLANDYLRKTSNFLATTFRDVPSNRKAEFVKNQAIKLEDKFGIPTPMTDRLYAMGPENVLKPENMMPYLKNTPVTEISQETINKVSSLSDEMLKKLGKEYEASLGSAFKSNKEYNVSDIASSIRSDIDRLLEDSTKIKSPSLTKISQLKNSLDSYLGTGDSVTLKELHQLKQDINIAFKSPALKNNPEAVRLLSSIKERVVNKADDISPLYKAINNEYRTYLNLDDELAGLSNPQKATKLLTDYFNPSNTNLRTDLTLYMKKMGSAGDKIWNDALNEETARHFVSTVKKGGKGAGTNIPGIPAQVSLPRIGSSSAMKTGVGIVRSSQYGGQYLSPTQKGIAGGLNAAAAGAIQQPFNQ